MPGRVNDIGDWLRRSFRTVATHLAPLSVLFVAAAAVVTAIAYLLVHLLVADTVFFLNDGRVEGFGLGTALALAVVAVAATIGWTATYLGGFHFLHGAHRMGRVRDSGTDIDPVRSLLVGLARVPRYFGVMLVLVLAVIAVLGGGFALIFGVAVSGADTAVLPLLILLLTIVLVPLFAWFTVKVAFVPVSAVAVPPGRSALLSSWGVSRGRFWPILGRLALWYLLTSVLSMVNQVIVQIGFPALVLSWLELGPNGELLVDGRPIESLDVLVVSDLLPNPIVAAGVLAFLAGLTGAVQMASASMLVSLYVDAESNPVGSGPGSGRR